MTEELTKCKKCGSYPTLYTPSPFEEKYKGLYGQILNQNLKPYYRCEGCRVLAEKEERDRLIRDWNNGNK